MSRIRTLPVALAAALMAGSGVVAAQDDQAPGIDGTWSVDTSIGDFDADFGGSWAGFRVAEVLSPGGEVDAVGRTPLVSGQLEASGSVIESVQLEVDLTGIVSDRPRRDGAIQRALETGEFPVATFVSTEPVDLGQVPPEGEAFSASVPGTLTIRGIGQEVTAEMQGGLAGETVVVVGTLPVDFTAFEVTMPTAPIVVSVEDSGDLEWQLYFTRDAEMMDAEMMDEDDMAEDDLAEE